MILKSMRKISIFFFLVVVALSSFSINICTHLLPLVTSILVCGLSDHSLDHLSMGGF